MRLVLEPLRPMVPTITTRLLTSVSRDHRRACQEELQKEEEPQKEDQLEDPVQRELHPPDQLKVVKQELRDHNNLAKVLDQSPKDLHTILMLHRDVQDTENEG